MQFVAEKEAYLNKKEDVRSVGDAQLQLTLISVYEVEARDVENGEYFPNHSLLICFRILLLEAM